MCTNLYRKIKKKNTRYITDSMCRGRCIGKNNVMYVCCISLYKYTINMYEATFILRKSRY